MTMWHLERELKKTGDPQDRERAEIIRAIRLSRGKEISLPPAVSKIKEVDANDSPFAIDDNNSPYLLERRSNQVLTIDLANQTKNALLQCPDESTLISMSFPILEKRVNWQINLPFAPENWVEYYISLDTVQKRFVSQSLRHAANHFARIQNINKNDISLGILRQYYNEHHKIDIPQQQTGALINFVFSPNKNS